MSGRWLLLLCVVCFGLGALFTPAMQRLQNRVRRISRAAEAPPLDARLHARQRSQFALLNSPDRVWLVGDSRIDEGQWDELLGRADVANRGISGDTTAGLLARLDETFPRAVDVCVLQIGVNDLMQGADVELTRRNYLKILRQIQDRELAKIVVVTSVLLTDHGSHELNERIAELNTALMQLTLDQRVRWVDVNAVLAPSGHLEEKYTNDGTHLTGEGYVVFAAALKAVLEQVVSSR